MSTAFSTSNSGAGSVYEIVNKLSAKVLDVTGASTNDGAIIQQWDFNGGGQQKWTIVPVESPYYIKSHISILRAALGRESSANLDDYLAREVAPHISLQMIAVPHTHSDATPPL